MTRRSCCPGGCDCDFTVSATQNDMYTAMRIGWDYYPRCIPAWLLDGDLVSNGGGNIGPDGYCYWTWGSSTNNPPGHEVRLTCKGDKWILYGIINRPFFLPYTAYAEKDITAFVTITAGKLSFSLTGDNSVYYAYHNCYREYTL